MVNSAESYGLPSREHPLRSRVRRPFLGLSQLGVGAAGIGLSRYLAGGDRPECPSTRGADEGCCSAESAPAIRPCAIRGTLFLEQRSEERRVGKEVRRR